MSNILETLGGIRKLSEDTAPSQQPSSHSKPTKKSQNNDNPSQSKKYIKVNISVELLKKLDLLKHIESCSRGELINEACRRYLSQAKVKESLQSLTQSIS